MSETVDSSFLAERAQLKHVLPYLTPAWRGYLTMGGDTTGAIGYALPGSIYRSAMPAEPYELACDRLEATRISLAVLDPGNSGAISAIANADLAAAAARATNEWQAAEWLDRDERFRGSIVVGPRDARLAAEEVGRASEHGAFVQVLLSYPPSLLGDRSLYPLYAAACEAGLPVTLVPGGAFSGANGGLTGAGFPATAFEYELGTMYSAQPHLLSLVLNGVFERFPTLRVVFAGFGAAWLPSLLWRAEREFRLGRLERPPGLTRLPGEIVAEHVRLTTAPLELPDDPEQYAAALAPVEAERLLLFASGPLRDDPRELEGLPEGWRRLVLCENAAALYRLSVAA